jgi:hypothetical protein
VTRDTIIEITTGAARGAGLDPDAADVRAFRNNVAASVLGEFEWARDVRAALEDVEAVARQILHEGASKDRLGQLDLALREVDRLRSFEKRDAAEACTADGAYSP